MKPIASIVPSSAALSCEGPFDAYCKPGDTGEHPLISNWTTRVSLPDDNLPVGGCGTRRSDIRSPATSPSIPRVHRGARVGPVVGSFPGRIGPSDESPERSRRCVGIAARCRTHGFEFIGVESVCHVATSNVN